MSLSFAGNIINPLFTSVENIQDLVEFIRHDGLRTYPVWPPVQVQNI